MLLQHLNKFHHSLAALSIFYFYSTVNGLSVVFRRKLLRLHTKDLIVNNQPQMELPVHSVGPVLSHSSVGSTKNPLLNWQAEGELLSIYMAELSFGSYPHRPRKGGESTPAPKIPILLTTNNLGDQIKLANNQTIYYYTWKINKPMALL